MCQGGTPRAEQKFASKNSAFGGVSEWPMVSDSKSDVRKHRGFKSLLLRQGPDRARQTFQAPKITWGS